MNNNMINDDMINNDIEKIYELGSKNLDKYNEPIGISLNIHLCHTSQKKLYIQQPIFFSTYSFMDTNDIQNRPQVTDHANNEK
jgi:hypothetical protein